jgi:hypothetical protein
MVWQDNLPDRPDMDPYLPGRQRGALLSKGAELPSLAYTATSVVTQTPDPAYAVWPNPVH